MPKPRFSPSLAPIALACVVASGCASCGQSTLCAFKSRVNDPANRSMRRGLMSSGLSEFCKQMTTHQAPLRMDPSGPVIGRYYPQQCQQKELENGDLFVQFSGVGYGYTNLSKKVTFSMSGAVEYNQDFLVHDEPCSIYAYFRVRRIAGSDFRTRVVENPVASFANQLTGLGDKFGQQLVGQNLAQGFTVIHDDRGDDVSLGIVDLGKRPPHPFDVHGSGRITVENARTEVHQNQRDFIGPIEIDANGRALYVAAQLEGAPAVDVLVLRKEEGEGSLRLYWEHGPSGPLSGAPLGGWILQAGTPLQQAVPLPKGMYYVVLDNTPTAGAVAPPVNLLDDRAAVVSYALQIGDAP